MPDLEDRVRNLEDWKHAMNTDLALAKQDRKHLDARFTAIDKSLEKINSGFSKIFLAVGLLVLGAGVTFVLGGGLNIAP